MENLMETLKSKLAAKLLELKVQERKVYADYAAATRENAGVVAKRGELLMERKRQVRLAQQELAWAESMLESLVREVTMDDDPLEVSRRVVREVENYSHNSLVRWL